MLDSVRKKVLVAEQDEVMRETVTDYLEAIGCEVAVCGDHKSLLREVCDTAYNAVLVGDDIEAAAGPGLVAQLLRTRTTAAIIALVAYRSVEQIIDLYRRGAVDVVIRPYQYQELGAALTRAFERNRQNLICAFVDKHRHEIGDIPGSDRLEWEVPAREVPV